MNNNYKICFLMNIQFYSVSGYLKMEYFQINLIGF